MADPTSTDDKKVVFTYDYMSRRVRKQSFFWSTDHWQLATDQLFVYDDWNVIMVLDGLNSNAITRKYTWGLDLSGTFHDAGGIGGLLAVEETSGPHQGSYWFLYDANGNVGQVLDPTDTGSITIAAHYEYDPYGNALVATGTYAADNPFRFSTKWHDSETSLYYYGYRYYSPGLGRWTNKDPLTDYGFGFAGPDHLRVNYLKLLYVFVANTPTRFIDPIGLQSRPADPPTSQPEEPVFPGAGSSDDPMDLTGLDDYLKNSSDEGCGVCLKINPRRISEWTVKITRVNPGCNKTSEELEKKLNDLFEFVKVKVLVFGHEEKCEKNCKCENKRDLPRKYYKFEKDWENVYLEYTYKPPYYVENGCTGDLQLSTKMRLDGLSAPA